MTISLVTRSSGSADIQSAEPAAGAKTVKKTRRTKSYKHGFWGYTHYRLIAYDPTNGTIARNAMGDSLEKTIGNIFHLNH